MIDMKTSIIAGHQVWPSIQAAVPQTYGEAVALWGIDVIRCEPHEWDNRMTEENALWLLCSLHVRRSLELLMAMPCAYCDKQPCVCEMGETE